MSTIVVRRLPRPPEPDWPSGELALDPPPELPDEGRRNFTRIFMILPMLAGSGAMAMMYSRSGGGGGPLGYLPGALFSLSALGMLAVVFSQQASGKNKRQMVRDRRRYMRHLSQQRGRVQRTVAQQRRAASYRHPDPESLWGIPASARLWERRRGEADFAQLRVGLGPQELATPITPPASQPLEDLEPMCALALRRFVVTYAVVPDLPIVMALNGFSAIYLRGDPDRTRGLARALLAQVVALHAPDDLLVAVCAGPSRRAQWEWVKWLPHALHPTRTDALGPVRLVADDIATIEAVLDDVLASRPRFSPTTAPAQSATPHLVVLLDGAGATGSEHLLAGGGVDGVTVIALDGQPPRVLDPAKLVLQVSADGALRSATYGGAEELGRADQLSLVEAEALALQLAPLRRSAKAETETEEPLSADVGLAELLELGDPYAFDVATAWVPRANRDRLRVPIGVGPDGRPVELDLKESAQDGMGPHGLLIGATGSGKSELLRTLVLALAATHDSTTLNFVLVDFKGGATFTRLDRLPHTSAVITNLADELPLVDRMTDAINGELIRRQELLRQAGNYASQRDYEQARKGGTPLAPLPSLLVICDEFSELLTAKPDFIDMFVQIGRVGRSLGVHLLLASQRLEEGRLRGLDTHLSYRIGLRTFSGIESRVVLGVQDAYHLPRTPGHGFLKAGTDSLTRFKAAYVSGGHRSPVPALRDATGAVVTVDPVRRYDTAYHPAPARQPGPAPAVGPGEPAAPEVAAAEVAAAPGDTLLDLLVDRIAGRGEPAHQVWLPPLREPPTLDQLLPPAVVAPGRGLTAAGPDQPGSLSVPVGIVDKPLEQRRDPLLLDLASAAGHVMVVGAPQSGKSTLLRSLVVALALTHTPRDVQVYCLDFGGGALSGLRELPHVGGVATRRDVSQVRRTIAELRLLLAQREEWFARHGVDSMASYRRRLRSDPDGPDRFGDVFLVVDGWATIRAEFDDQVDALNDLANRGLSFGVHVVASAGRWMDVRHTIRDVFGTRLELRLGDPADSMLGRRAAMNVPEHAPGRGITSDGRHFLSALPRADAKQTADDLAEGARQLVADLRQAWDGPPAPAVRLLPANLPDHEIPTGDGPGLPIGIAETDLRPVHLDFRANPHFLLFGAAECGKSSFLRALAHRVVERYSPEQARLLVVDYRRSLLGAITTEHQIGYGSSAQVTADLVKETAGVMRRRLPGPDVTPQQLRDRSWWTGPELYLLVDDYDLVSAAQPNPLAPLLEFLPQARDVGLHLVLARRSGGAARSMFEQFVQRLKELDTPGLVMSGSRDEGKLLGDVRPSPLPPGRGWLVTRDRGAQLVQLAHRPPD
ncbi:MAG: type VII secretion protein EccCa [Micromonosporaceae bacterium]|nr:type VII secretion protein EccCa [Micromonosporaceae bacterium]